MVPGIGHSFRRKVMFVVVTTTLVALVIAATAMLFNDARTYKQSWTNDLATQASILALTGAPALAFNDPKAARENLAALRVKENILAAAMYTQDGVLFASYVRDGEQAPPARIDPAKQGAVVVHGNLEMKYAVQPNGESLGTIYLRAHDRSKERLTEYLGILAVVMLGSFIVALLTSTRLQAALTSPILTITDVARRIMDRRDFSLRATKTSDDEIGTLVDAFNGMLDEVGRHATALEAADHRKDEFLATLAHELRNPLAPIRTSLEILRLNPNPEATLKAREILERQVKQMTRLVDDLLDVSRITTGKLIVNRVPIVLQNVLNDAVETVSPLITARNQSLEVQLPSAPVHLQGDATRLAQVFANLLNNATKYTAEAGRIRLTAELEGQGRQVAVHIEDNGHGINPENLQHIFEMFTQAEHPLDRVQSGLGVGLALSRRLIELHSGSITASSAGLGHGSQFTVRIPTAQ